MNSYSHLAAKSDILLVDDNLENLRLLARILNDYGYKVRKAINGTLALKAVEVVKSDLILLDINMPGMNGYDVCQRLKSNPNTANIPVIFLSALGEVIDKLKAFEVGGADYITKPFEVQEVLVRIKNQLTISWQHKQLLEQQQQLTQANEQLQREKEFSERLINSSVDGILAFDHEGNYTIWNPSMERLSGIRGEQILGKSALEVFPFSQGIGEESVVRTILAGEIVICKDQPYEILQTGRSGFFEGYYSPLTDKLGEIIGGLGIIRDITKRKQAEELLHQQEAALATAKARVEAIEKLNRLKDDFLSTVSHELRTPLSSIQLAIQMLEISLLPLGVLEEESHPVSRYVQILKDELQREICLINDLLDLSCVEAGIEPLEITTMDLSNWIKYIAEPFVERTRSSQQNLQIKIPANLKPLTTDFSYLQRILTELLSNACKFTPVGETITVSALGTPELLYLGVSNSGVEIPEGERVHVFDKLYRLPQQSRWQYSGMGLGLALVKKLVEQLQGSIEVTSGQNLTTFTVKLPYI